MKYYLILSVAFMLACTQTASAENNYDGYMEGHPGYNQDYYSPSYNNSDSTPNYDSNYYNKTYDYNNSYSNDSNDAPHGNDIRDYNPAYDRYGNLK